MRCMRRIGKLRIRCAYTPFFRNHAHTLACSALLAKIITKIWFFANFSKPITYTLITLANSSTSLHMRCMCGIGKLRIRCAYTLFYRNHAHTFACSALLVKIITTYGFQFQPISPNLSLTHLLLWPILQHPCICVVCAE